jgi:hypothetical protein
MDLDEWVVTAQNRLREAAREAEKRPELKEKFTLFLAVLIKAGKYMHMSANSTKYFMEKHNPVVDVVSFIDLSNTLRDAHDGSNLEQRERSGYWVRGVFNRDPVITFDEWVPMAKDRLREALREVAKRPDLKADFRSLLAILGKTVPESDIDSTQLYMEKRNPVADVVSLRDLSYILGDVFDNSNSKQRSLFCDADWVRAAFDRSLLR